MKYHPNYPARIVAITERDFWSSQTPPKNPIGTILADARRAGLRGRKSEAYALLAEYHAHSTAAVWKHFLAGNLPVNHHAPRQTYEDVCCHRLFINVSDAYQYEKQIDWNTPATGSIIHSWYWILPLLYVYAERSNPADAARLRDFIDQYYAARHTMRKPEPDYHPVYTALGASIKFRHLFPTYLALAANRHLTPETTEAAMKMMLGMSRALYRRETDFVLSNQTVTNVEAFGLFGSAFPEFDEASAMRARAIERVEQNLVKGFLPDGGYYERSFDYTIVTLKDAANVLRGIDACTRLSRKTRTLVANVFRNAVRFLAKTAAWEGYRPAFADGCLKRCPDMLHVVDDFLPAPERGGAAVSRGESYHLPDTGFSVMRNGATKNSLYVFFTHAPCHLWHSHQDLLGMNLWRGDAPLLEEAGRAGGYNHPLDRVYRTPEMHNTIAIDGQMFDERHPELWRGTDVRWDSAPQYDCASACHRAYRGAMPTSSQMRDYTLRRTILFIKDPGYCVVLDSALAEDGGAPGVLSQYWHAVQPFGLLSHGSAVSHASGQGILIHADAGHWLRREQLGTDYLASEGDASLEYPARYRLHRQFWGETSVAGAIGCVSLLMPYTGKAPRFHLERAPLGEGLQFRAERIAISCRGRTDVLELDPETLCPRSKHALLGRIRLGKRHWQPLGAARA